MGFNSLSKKDVKRVLVDIFVPDIHVDYVWDINLQALRDSGCESILLDLDNTLLMNSQRNMSLQHLNWVQKCKDFGFDVYIVSNNRSYRRVKRALDQMQCKGIYLAFKPFTFSILQLAKRYNIDLSKSSIVGDQLFKDVIAGNWLKMTTILVNPLDSKSSLFFRLQHELELYIRRKLTH